MSLYHKQTGETLPTVSANKDRIIPELSRHPRPTSEKKKRKEKKTPFLSKERETFAMHVAVSVIMLEWHFKSQFGAGVKVEA